MNLSIYIARRYLISKKSHNIINIISLISITGVAIGTMALIIVLSVFNGFDNLVVSLFNTFNAPLQVTPARGKTMITDTLFLEKLQGISGVGHIAEIIEAEALMKYNENQTIVTIKGVSENYAEISGVDSMIVEGAFLLEEQEKPMTVTGYGIAGMLSLNLRDYLNPIIVYIPRRDAPVAGGFDQAFNQDIIFPSGFFQVQYDYDIRYAFVPLQFAIGLTGYEHERTSLEISPQPGQPLADLQKRVEKFLGKDYIVKNRFQQQEILYQIMNSEKKYIFMILTLILIIATFNVIGTLSMLILDKKTDIAVLRSMGATQHTIRRIFLAEGLLISLIGAVSGLLLGGLICWLQIRYGFVKLGNEESSFVVDAYPVLMKTRDFVLVFFTVMIIGLLAAIYPVYNIRKIDTTMTRGE